MHETVHIQYNNKLLLSILWKNVLSWIFIILYLAYITKLYVFTFEGIKKIKANRYFEKMKFILVQIKLLLLLLIKVILSAYFLRFYLNNKHLRLKSNI